MTDGGAQTLFGGILRLVPYSGIQFYDVLIPRALSSDLKTLFIEERFDSSTGNQRILLPLEPPAKPVARVDPIRTDDVAELDGFQTEARATLAERLIHPVTGDTVDPATVLELDGSMAIARFAGTWTPLPFLRFVGRDTSRRPQYDAGPLNWVRAFVNPPNSADPTHIVVTLAFDTGLSGESRLDAQAYLSPNTDDAAFGSTFVCASTVDDVAPFLAEPWLEAWLAKPPATEGPAPPVSATDTPLVFEHRHFAQYLTLLRLLATAEVIPEVRFTDTIERRFPIRVADVDLILDIGDVETTALLVDVTYDGNGDIPLVAGFAEPLRFRDLTRPGVVHEGSFPTAAEFSGIPFGDASLSRDSGRGDAFHWPSLVRIGHEAKRLALRNNGAEGVTGLSNLRSFLLDDIANPGLWRQSTDDRADGDTSGDLGPMVSGTVLGHVGENGTLLGAGSVDASVPTLADQRAAIRPRFSRASMISFFSAELVLHALSQINEASRGGHSSHENDVRNLRNVVVLAPPALSLQERQALLMRVDRGVELAWRGLGWDRVAPGLPARPVVSQGIGGDLGTQIAFLHNEVTTKYQGRFRDLLRVYRGGDMAGSAAEALRVASVEFGARATTLTIVDYAASEQAVVAHEWQPTVQVQERLPVGTDAALQTLIWTLLLPAIESHLSIAGLDPARHFLDEITGRSATSLLVEDPYFTRRLNRKILWPAAQGLFRLGQQGATSLAHGNRAVGLATLVDLGGGRMSGVAEAFDQAALLAGARGFALDQTKIDLDRGGLARIIRGEMQDCIQQVCRMVAANSCDLLLLCGEGSLLPPVGEAVLAALPVAASRIIDLNTHANQAAADAFGHVKVGMTTAAILPAIAAALDRRQALETSGFGQMAMRRLANAGPGADEPGADGPASDRGQEMRAIGAPVSLTDDSSLGQRVAATRGNAAPQREHS